MSYGAATKELKSRSEALAKRCKLEQLRVQGLVRGSCTHKTKQFSRKPCLHKTLNKTVFSSRAGTSLVRTRPQFSKPTQKSCSTLYEPCAIIFGEDLFFSTV